MSGIPSISSQFQQKSQIQPVPRKHRRKPTKPISLRLNDEERQRLKAEAGRRTLSALIRERLFGPQVQSRRVYLPKYDEKALGQVLALLGQSGIAACLRDLCEAVRVGALPVTPETEEDIKRACHSVKTMRSDLIRALGLIEAGKQ